MLRSFLVGFALLPASVFAMPIISGDGTETCDGGACTVIGQHVLWQPANPFGQGAAWISYSDTGVYGDDLAATGTTMEVVETFEATAQALFEFLIWADDTADVFLDDVQYYAANFTQGTCAADIIGCEPNEYGMLSGSLGAGLHTLRIVAHQVGTGTTNASNPFGVLYTGHVTSTVPEPGSFALIGAGFLALGIVRWRVRGAA